MGVAVVRSLGVAGSSKGIAQLVLAHKVEAQADEDNNEQRVAAEVRGKGNKVARAVPAAEDLGANGVNP